MTRPGRLGERPWRLLAPAAVLAAVLSACGGPSARTFPMGGFVGPPPQGTLFGAPFVPTDACAVPAGETTCRFPAQGTLQAAGLLLVLAVRPELGLFMAQHGAYCGGRGFEAKRAGEASVQIQMLRAGPAAQLGNGLEVILGTHPVNTGLSALSDGTLWGIDVQAVRINGQCRELKHPSVTGFIRLDYATGGSVRGALDLVTDDGGNLAGEFEIRTCPAALDACEMIDLPYCAVACYP